MSAMSPILGVGSLTLFIHRDRETAIVHRIGYSGTRIVSGDDFRKLDRLLLEAGPFGIRHMEDQVLHIIDAN